MTIDVGESSESVVLLSIGAVAERTGLAVSAIRFYADHGLIHAERSTAGHRRFARSTLRRLSFIQILQKLGYTLDEVKAQLDHLPDARTPTKEDWAAMATGFERDIAERVRQLQELQASLSSCIGCGCLSLQHCAIWNPGDVAQTLGTGPRYLLGDSSNDVL